MQERSYRWWRSPAVLYLLPSSGKHCPYSGTMPITGRFFVVHQPPGTAKLHTEPPLSGLGGKAWVLFPQPLPGFKCSPPVTSMSGPPGPPEAVTIDEITDTTAQLSWRPGADNHSPITMYVVQARTPFSVGWQAVSTGKCRAPSTPRGAALPKSHFPGCRTALFSTSFKLGNPKI